MTKPVLPNQPPSNIFGTELKNSNPYRLYLAMRAIGALAFSLVITYELVYHTTEIALNPIQLVTVGVVLECMTFFFEIPTGLVADVYSRRLSILIGVFLIGIGFLVEGLIPLFGAVILTQILWGVGFTFYSGAAEAWITDEIGIEQADQALIRGAQFAQVARFAGISLGALLVNYQLHWPITAGAIIYLALTILLAFTMAETGFQPDVHSDTQPLFDKMVEPLREGVKQIKIRPVLGTIMLLGAIIGLSLGGFDRINATHIIDNFTFPELGGFEPIAWFSIISLVVGVLSLLGTELARRSLRKEDQRVANVLLALYSGMVVFTLVFVLSGRFYLAITAYCLSQALRNTGRPLIIIWINQNAPSAVRATMISMYWQSNALGQIIGSPIIGWIGTLFSVRAALTAGGIIYSLVLPLLKFGPNEENNSPDDQ